MSLWHTIYRVNWGVVLDLYQKGILVETLLAEEVPDWAESYSELPISNNLYCAVADAYEQLRTGLTDDTRQKADSFMLPLITFQRYHQDLDHQNLGSLIQSLNPKSVVKFALLAEEIDWDSFKAPYYNLCHDSTRETIATYSNLKRPDKSFRKGFLSYIEEEWVEPIYMAARKKQGILVDLS